jgi:mRNA interferase MazF
MRRGEIRWYRFARPDKKRPVLILTRDSVMLLRSLIGARSAE